MDVTLWFSDPKLEDRHFRALVAIQAWNQCHPDGRPTNKELGSMCGWDESKMRRVLRELKNLGRLDRGTESSDEQDETGRIVISDVARSFLCVLTTASAPLSFNPFPRDKRQVDENHGSGRPPILVRPPEPGDVSREQVTDQLKAFLREVANRAHQITFPELEDYASRFDAMMGYDPTFRYRPDMRQRYCRFLLILEGVANGYPVADVLDGLKPDRHSRRRVTDPFTRTAMYELLHEVPITIRTWRQHLRLRDKREGTSNYRSIIPFNLTSYHLPGLWKAPEVAAS